MEDRVDLEVGGQRELHSHRVDDLAHRIRTSPLSSKFLGKSRVQAKVISLEPNQVSNLKSDVPTMLVSRCRHAASSTSQVVRNKFLHFHTLLNKLINTNHFIVLQLRESMVKGQSRIKTKHYLTRRNLSATMATSIQNKRNLR